MAEDDPDKYPEKDSASGPFKALQVAAGALDLAVPLAGATANAILTHFIAEPLQDRRDQFFKRLAERVSQLEQLKHLRLADLRENEDFVDVVADAAAISLRTHDEEKREALVNAAANTAAGYKIDDILRGSFMGMLNRYSGLHLRVLRVLSDPGADAGMVQFARNVYAGSAKRVLSQALGEPPDAVLDRVLRDFESDGLTNGSMGGMATGSSMLDKRTSETGDAFLRFITTPLT